MATAIAWSAGAQADLAEIYEFIARYSPRYAEIVVRSLLEVPERLRDFIAEMQRLARGEAFDEHAMPGLDSEAIAFRAASESFAAVSRLGKKDLDTLRLVTTHQGGQVRGSASTARNFASASSMNLRSLL